MKQSKGVFIHNPLFRLAKKDAVYCRFETADIRSFIRTVGQHLKGFSVTTPHKEAIVRLLGAVDRTANVIGAVNTVIRRGGRLCGTNTDAAVAGMDPCDSRAPAAADR